MDLRDIPFAAASQKVEEPRGGQVAWTDQLATGIEVLDQQHRRYIDLLNVYLAKAAEWANADEKTRQIVESFDFLRSYAEEHFATEDSIMEETNYPDYALHRKEHQHFIDHVEELSHQMAAEGFSPKLAREVNFYAIEWFVDHILGSDMQLVQFLKDRNLEDKANEYGP